MLKTVLTEISALTEDEMNLFCSGLMIDNFAIEFYGVGEGTNVPFCPCLRGGSKTRSIRQIQDLLIRDISYSETD